MSLKSHARSISSRSVQILLCPNSLFSGEEKNFTFEMMKYCVVKVEKLFLICIISYMFAKPSDKGWLIIIQILKYGDMRFQDRSDIKVKCFHSCQRL